jgi:HlyD family secretion protein
MKIPKAAWLIAAGIAAAALVVFLLRPDPVSVDLRVVSRGPLAVTVDEDGVTRVRERYVVSSPVTGRMVRLECDAGDEVTEGQILARVFPLPLDTRTRTETARRLEAAEASWRAAMSAVDRAETGWADALRRLERLERVAADVRGAVAEERLDAARSEERSSAEALDEARAVADAARHQVEATRATLLTSDGLSAEPTLVPAPASGRVLRLYEECERAVSAGSPILEIGDPAALEVVVDVLTEDATELTAGATAWVRGGAGQDSVRGRIERIEPSAFTRVSPLGVEEQRVNVIVAFDDPPPALGDRFRVRVSLVAWQADDVLRVPVGALFREGEGWAVFTVEGEEARRRSIQLGHRGRESAEVLSGLDAGQAVVVYPSDAVRDGVTVRADGEAGFGG